MPRKALSRPERRHLTYLRGKVRESGLTLHTRLRRVNIPAGFDFNTLPDLTREHLRGLLACGYQLQLYIPSADPRQDAQSQELAGPRCLRAAAQPEQKST